VPGRWLIQKGGTATGFADLSFELRKAVIGWILGKALVPGPRIAEAVCGEQAYLLRVRKLGGGFHVTRGTSVSRYFEEKVPLGRILPRGYPECGED